ncbi:MAG: hypothetical protein JRI99_08555, partial [Deltaproteobacteria bacterium]|nr:hypothetical protein [Deltaproteobacteria bacterium]
MKKIFFFNKLVAAGCYLLFFFMRCWPGAMLLKKTKPKLRAAWIVAAFGVLALLLTAGAAAAAPCDVKNNTPPFIRHDLTVSYCELCRYGYITIVISNPYEGADMTDMMVVENLGSSGLTFDPTAPNPVTYSVNGGLDWPGSAPAISGPNSSILTWTSAQISELSHLDWQPGNSVGTLAITFAVSRAGGLSQEGLINATRQITAQLTYSAVSPTVPPTIPPTYIPCPGMPSTVATGVDTLPLREPRPEVSKRGRNYDADQDSWEYSQTVYGNGNDDVIWRIRVRNTGLADLQDLRFDDLMQTGNVEINYACPTEAAASAVAANNGIDPGGGGCVPASNTINNFDVDNPFGNPNNDSPDLVDVREGEYTHIYLVGKIPSSPNGSCSSNRINTVSDIQWGCQADSPPAGGITTTSTGYTAGNATATLSTLSVNSGSNLNIQTEIIGTNTSQPAGSKG